MKKHRFLSAALSAALLISSATAIVPHALAEDVQPEGNTSESYRPWKHGYRITDVKNWSPETDRYSSLMGNKVPLQERIDTFAPTQANPALSDKTKLYNITDDYRCTGPAPFDMGAYNDEFSNNIYKFWQYTDLYGGGGRPSAGIRDGVDDMEYAIVDFPNSAYISAAHKNGVKSFGMLFLPRTPQYVEEMLFQDENGDYPVAKKLAEMADYYGFDGYFINQETGISSDFVRAYKEFAKYLQEQGLDISWYDVTNSNTGSGPSYSPYLREDHSGWLIDQELGRVCDSMFINYNWNEGDGNTYSKNVVKTNELLDSLGLDPFEDVYFGVESNLGRFGGTHNSTRNLDQIFDPETGNPMASLALWSSGFTSNGLDDDLGDDNQRRRYDKDYQWMVEERERMLYTGVLQDAAHTDQVPGFSYPEAGVKDGSRWTGISRYISERSVIGGGSFYTNFNTGHGLEWRLEGQRISGQEWSNISQQDILPTWQWWIDSAGTALQADYDYGPEYNKAPRFSYQQVGAYQGGSSLAVSGTLDAENVLRLYKTDLSVTEDTRISLTYNKVSATDGSKMELGVIFKSAPETMVTVNIPKANQQTGGWVTKSVDLSDYAGEEIVAMGLVFDNGKTSIENYQMNIGELKVTDGTDQAPAAPTGFAIDKSIDSTQEMLLTWDLADYSEVKNYHLYAQREDGSLQFLGGIYDDSYYVSSAYNSNEYVKFLLKAVGDNGIESEAAVVEYRKENAPSRIQVDNQAGYLDVSWQNPAADYQQMKLSVTFDYSAKAESYTQTLDADAASARVYLPIVDGSDYTLRLTPVNAQGEELESACYYGQLKDLRCEPYQGEVHYLGNGKVALDTPLSEDWAKVYATIGGSQVTLGRYSSNLGSVSTGSCADHGAVTIVVEDRNGNRSVPVTRYYYADPAAQVDESMIPDPVLLEAVRAQAGETVQELSAFGGTLDLSDLDISDYTGLGLINAKEINLTGSHLESIQQGTFAAGVQKVVLTGSKQLKNLYPGSFTGTQIKEIELTGCTALQVLGLDHSNLERIVCGDAAEMTDMISVNMSASRFDLSEGTPEKAFADAMAQATQGKEDIVLIDPAESNLAPGATVVEEQTSIRLSTAKKLFDGKYTGSDYLNYSLPLDVVVDFGTETEITSWTVRNDGADYGLSAFEILSSNDGVTYETVSTVTGNDQETVTRKLETPVTARYFKLHGTEKMGWGNYMREWELNGKKKVTYPAGVQSGNQRPALYPGDMDEIVRIEKKLGGSVDMNSYLQASAGNAATIHGTTAEQLAGAGFIDPAYDLEGAVQAPEISMIRITDDHGNISLDSIDTSADGVYTVEYLTFLTDGYLAETVYTQTVYVRAVTSVLEQIIANAEELLATGALDNTMEAVVTEFNAALANAKEIAAKDGATQAEINAATTRLLEVMAKVDWKQGDKTALQVAVDIANAIKPDLDLYVEAGKQEFLDALGTAEALLASGNAWDDDIKAATAELMEAMSNLRMAANKDALNEMIDSAKSMDLGLYTEESASGLRTALQAAQALAADENATQDDVDAAAETLKAALNGLTFVSGGADATNGSDGTDSGENDANGGTTNVGDGSAPTKTGDGGSFAGAAALAVLSAAGALFLLKKKER